MKYKMMVLSMFSALFIAQNSVVAMEKEEKAVVGQDNAKLKTAKQLKNMRQRERLYNKRACESGDIKSIRNRLEAMKKQKSLEAFDRVTLKQEVSVLSQALRVQKQALLVQKDKEQKELRQLRGRVAQAAIVLPKLRAETAAMEDLNLDALFEELPVYGPEKEVMLTEESSLIIVDSAGVATVNNNNNVPLSDNSAVSSASASSSVASSTTVPVIESSSMLSYLNPFSYFYASPAPAQVPVSEPLASEKKENA